MFGHLGVGEMAIIFVVILLLFGAERMPEIASSLGKGIAEFKRNLSEAQRAITDPHTTTTRQSVSGSNELPQYVAPAHDDTLPEPKRLMH